ncbi:MAG: U32 family peptidase [Bacillales bacterium]|nr:U32 family peptidase [Bacillales bacterium]
MRKIELLAPAGDLERLKYAVMYGADAVFIGGKNFSLRSMASNFTLEDIKEGCDFAHKHHAKVHVTCNIVMHESDTNNIKEYLLDLEKCGVDAIIASSLTILKMVKTYTSMEAHVSTQQSISNSKGVEFLTNFGVDRVVLARECSIKDIENIKKKSNIDLEVFIEGGMCASFSGRCMLSNVMTNRDANRGGCAQSCRWNYDLYQNDKLISPNDHDFTMSSKDLNAMDYISKLIDIGVTSLKIEGRMKSLHYIATVVSAYRKLIDEYYLNHEIKNIQKYKDEISRGENRQTSYGFYNGDVKEEQEIYNDGFIGPSHEFCGIVLDYDKENKLVKIEQRNHFVGNREFEILSKAHGVIKLFVSDIYDKDMNVIDAARHSQMIVYFYSDIELEPFDLIR